MNKHISTISEFFSPNSALAHSNEGYHMDGMMWGGGMSGFGFIGIILNLIFWMFIIIGIIFLIKFIAKQSENNKDSKENNSLKILKERLAKGEIEEKEYEQKKKLLKK